MSKNTKNKREEEIVDLENSDLELIVDEDESKFDQSKSNESISCAEDHKPESNIQSKSGEVFSVGDTVRIKRHSSIDFATKNKISELVRSSYLKITKINQDETVELSLISGQINTRITVKVSDIYKLW